MTTRTLLRANSTHESTSPLTAAAFTISAPAFISATPRRTIPGAYTLALVDPDAGDTGSPMDGSIIFDGSDGNDDLRGGPGPDTLRGGAGHDSLYGLGGQDFLIGNRGDDTLEGGDDDDLLLGDDINPLQRIFFQLFPGGMPVADDGGRGIGRRADDDPGAAASEPGQNVIAGASEPGQDAESGATETRVPGPGRHRRR